MSLLIHMIRMGTKLCSMFKTLCTVLNLHLAHATLYCICITMIQDL